MKDIPREAKLAAIVAAIPVLLAIITILSETRVLLFITGIAILVLFFVFHLTVLVAYLQTPKNERDDEWRRGMNVLRICHLMYIAAIVLLVVGWNMLLS